jgi:hypothetical protein
LVNSKTEPVAQTIHQELLKSCVGNPLSESDALVWMVLLHTHTIHLKTDAIAGANGVSLSFPALTRRGGGSSPATGPS